ncbi:2-C-methyl-D-erythritol 2,4-cyclodiphosphate synthase [Thermodesulfatator autotrophicus]|uniref:2-C-methyl-D-erythritol 2,4-cyclodiphosphate synthase n=1 Tax=Thermodesulfatator autotrophicus TaxID=1795632 RepID=A0A177E9R5_9BACT|nr:2-C-methyl-D-erythritol 2,4-cyclodiphosphate synthase [Thermodesulfatator autotrophicus]OAG28538.1 2-C-methyl-D-erythritol 2,4-cyclodiphosphate synthase [Thermodesulfatator autotrophicus]
MRVGFGFDVHRFAPERKLILCGVEIPYHLGLLGHSDADVATHALIDALLGAAGLGDIGEHFPDSDEKYRGVSSLILLEEVIKMLSQNGFKFVNADLTIVAEKPKISPYRTAMKEKLAQVIGCPLAAINIKGKTTEKLGFTGRGEGIAAYAVALITHA